MGSGIEQSWRTLSGRRMGAGQGGESPPRMSPEVQVEDISASTPASAKVPAGGVWFGPRKFFGTSSRGGAGGVDGVDGGGDGQPISPRKPAGSGSSLELTVADNASSSVI